MDGGEVALLDGLQRREDFAARLQVLAFLRPAGDAVAGADEVIAVVVGKEDVNAAVLGEVADGVATVRFGGQRQGGGGAGVFADVGERDAFGLGGNAVAEGIGGGMGAACDGGEEEGEDVVVHGVS